MTMFTKLQKENNELVKYIKTNFKLSKKEYAQLMRLLDDNTPIYKKEEFLIEAQEDLLKLRNELIAKKESDKEYENTNMEFIQTMAIIEFIKKNGDPEDFLYKKYSKITKEDIKKYLKENRRAIHKIYEYRAKLLS